MNYDEEPDNFLNSAEIEAAKNQNDVVPANTGDTISFTGEDAKRESQRRRRRRIMKVGLWTALVVIIIICGMSLYYFYPTVTDAQATGYIRDVERRGIFFKTGESRLYPSTGIVPADSFITFSVPSDSLFDDLQRFQSMGAPVTVTYKSSRGALIWRGESNRIITSVRPALLPNE